MIRRRGTPGDRRSREGLSALESLLFAKYQMYRNVYWHHAVRSATAMYKRLVEDALQAGVVDVQSAFALHRRRPAAPAREREADTAARGAQGAAPLQARARVAGGGAR